MMEWLCAPHELLLQKLQLSIDSRKIKVMNNTKSFGSHHTKVVSILTKSLSHYWAIIEFPLFIASLTKRKIIES